MRAKRDEHKRVLLLSVGFLHDEKIQGLTDAEFRSWVGVLFNQLEYGNGSPRLRSALSAKRRTRFLDLGLLVEDPDGQITIHAWDDWNGPKAWQRILNRQRQQRFRDRQRALREPLA